MKWGCQKQKAKMARIAHQGEDIEIKWTDIIQRLVDERQAQNVKDIDERWARDAKEESKLTQILATAQTIVELVVNPIRADVDAIKDTIAPLREELRDGLATAQTMAESVVNPIRADVDARIKGTIPPPSGRTTGQSPRDEGHRRCYGVQGLGDGELIVVCALC
jgi:hypothetical protein